MRFFRAVVSFYSALFFSLPQFARAQGTVPTFQVGAGSSKYTLAGGSPAQGRTTTIPTVLVPIALSFEAGKVAGTTCVMDADGDVRAILSSPVFSRFPFPN